MLQLRRSYRVARRQDTNEAEQADAFASDSTVAKRQVTESDRFAGAASHQHCFLPEATHS